jgi:hypothetical protein
MAKGLGQALLCGVTLCQLGLSTCRQVVKTLTFWVGFGLHVVFFQPYLWGAGPSCFFGTAASLLADLLAGTLHTLQPPEAGTCCTVACYTILLAYPVQPSIVMCCDIYAPG